MEIEQRESRSQAEHAYQVLRTEILHGALTPGQRLRANALRARYQLGLTPIREALTRLSGQGLVDGQAHRGARVSAASHQEFTDLMATRRAIERICLTQAIARGDTAWEAEIVASLHLLCRAGLPRSSEDRRAAAEWEVRHRRFHAALVAACGSEWLLRFWNMLADHAERYRTFRLLHRHAAEAEVCDMDAEHVTLMEAMLARDAARATALMDAHLLATERSVARLLADPVRSSQGHGA